jgi:hypothetical protein
MVFVEGAADRCLLTILGVPCRQVRIENGRDRVLGRLRTNPSAIGMVDEDPGSKPSRDLGNYRQVEADRGLRLLIRQGSGQRLIVLCPRLEDWLIQQAKSSGIRPEDFGLSGNPRRLHGIPHYEDTAEFRRFVEELIEQNARGIGLLREWVAAEAGPA